MYLIMQCVPDGNSVVFTFLVLNRMSIRVRNCKWVAIKVSRAYRGSLTRDTEKTYMI